jgi:hypothetical protein
MIQVMIIIWVVLMFIALYAKKKPRKTPKQVYRVKPMTQRTQDNYDQVKSLLDEAIMMLDEMQGDE